MVTGVVAACAVVVAGALVVLAVRLARLRSDRRLDSVLHEFDGHLEAISTSLGEAIDRFASARSERPLSFLTLDFDPLVGSVVAEAAARTGADAAVLHVEGPGGRPVMASYGASVDGELVERTFKLPSGTTSFQAARTDWTYRAADEEETLFHAALVTPLEPETGLAGTLAVFSTSPGAFHANHAASLHALLGEAAVGLSNARRFAEIEARMLLDPATGVPNPRGYEVELGREVARAHRTGRPLSVVLVGIAGNATSGSSERQGNGVAAVAQLLTRVTRKSDISCRRSEREFAILLPETRAAGATTLTSRLQEEAQRTLGVGRSTLTVDFVEWHPNETLEALAARADAALGRPITALAQRRLGVPESVAGPADDLRRDALESLASEITDAHRLGRPLSIVVLDVDGFDDIAERLGREVADAVLGEVATRLDESVGAGAGSVHRLGADEFVLVLPATTANDAEALLGALHGSLEPPADVERVTLGGGITELAEGDDAESALDRAEHALEQAQQVGHGTVVVAVPGIAAPRPS
jgi:diguanylate cyclase (GGDEF)-like protein